MKKLFCAMGLALLTVAGAAQAAGGGEQSLREALVQKEFFLRGFSAETDMRWKWSGKGLARNDPQFYTVGAVKVKSVKVNGERVVIQGDRRILLRKEGQDFELSPASVPVTIEVDLHGADMEKVLPELPRILFLPDVNAALAQIPRAYAGLIPANLEPPKDKEKSTCDCDHPEACQEDTPLISMVGIKLPEVKNAATGQLVKGLEIPYGATKPIVVAIDATGRVKYAWLGLPGDSESDQSALRAAKEFSFSPATCHDKPVSVVMTIHVGMSPSETDQPSRGKR